jgi:hypothetical protein
MGMAAAPAKIRRSLERKRRQAEELTEVFGLPADSLCAVYARSDKMNKLQRLTFYRKNHMKESGWLRNVGFILWG